MTATTNVNFLDRLNKEEKLSYLTAKQAEKDMKQTGEVKVICLKCNKKPTVRIVDNHVIYTTCQCGFVSHGELLEI